jgi:acetylornithine/N-succinyldiaminopimelate aminotransferase
MHRLIRRGDYRRHDPQGRVLRRRLRDGVKKAHIIDGRVEHAVLLEIFTEGDRRRQIARRLPSRSSANSDMNSEQWIARGDRVIMKTYGRYPIVPVRGEGCRAVGCRRQALSRLPRRSGGQQPRALPPQGGQGHPGAGGARLIHCSNYYHIPSQIELAELLCSHSFADRAFFCNSGAEANEAAIKLARKYSRENLRPGALRHHHRRRIVPRPYHGHRLGHRPGEGAALLRSAAARLQACPLQRRGGDRGGGHTNTCAIMLEPIQGEGGVNVPAAGLPAPGARNLRPAHGLLLILDEVQTGLGRTGKLFAYEHFGILPTS